MSEEEFESRKEEYERYDYIPMIDVLDLDIDKSTAGAIKLTQQFDYITRVRFVLTIADAAMEFTEFAEAVTLTNGFYMRIDGERLGPVVKDISDLASLGEIYLSASDADAVKVAYIRQVIVDFRTMSPGTLGLQIKSNTGKRVFDIYGQDDMTAVVKFKAVVEGWREI